MMDLKYVIYIAAKPEVVWQALTGEEGVKHIYFGCRLETTFQVGDDYAYIGPGSEGDNTVHVYGKILTYDPIKTLSISEHAGPSYRDNHADYETRVTYNLEAMGACTKLTLINDQWPADHPAYSNTQEAWPVVISNLKSFVETGKSLDLGW
jgi:uncharacterized protein YndB with AHSA1/START domain